MNPIKLAAQLQRSADQMTDDLAAGCETNKDVIDAVVSLLLASASMCGGDAVSCPPDILTAAVARLDDGALDAVARGCKNEIARQAETLEAILSERNRRPGSTEVH